MRLLVATSNPGKVSEFKAALNQVGFEVVDLASAAGHLPPPEETEDTFSGNARLKAEYYRTRLGLPTLSDDSGLTVEVLDGRPGVLSSRLGADDRERIVNLHAMIRQAEAAGHPADRGAAFVCSLCLLLEGTSIEVEGRVEGKILDVPRGSAGFGFDPIFYYPPLDKTFAELSAEEKNRVSHRARAIQSLLERLGESTEF